MHNIIKDLRNISGTKAKIEYIKDLDTVQKEELKQVLLAAMTPNVSYNFEVIPEYVAKEELYSLQDGLEKIKPLQQSIDENRDDYLTEILSHLSAENAHIIEMVIRDKINIAETVASKLQEIDTLRSSQAPKKNPYYGSRRAW